MFENPSSFIIPTKWSKRELNFVAKGRKQWYIERKQLILTSFYLKIIHLSVGD